MVLQLQWAFFARSAVLPYGLFGPSRRKVLPDTRKAPRRYTPGRRQLHGSLVVAACTVGAVAYVLPLR